MKEPDAPIWKTAMANDLGRLAQGVSLRMRSRTNTIFFMHPSNILQHKKAAYRRLVLSIRPLKSEAHRVRVTVGGNRLEYEDSTASIPAQLSTVKMH